MRVVANKVRDDSDEEFLKSRIPEDAICWDSSTTTPKSSTPTGAGISPYDISPSAVDRDPGDQGAVWTRLINEMNHERNGNDRWDCLIRVFRGSDEMYFKAEAELNAVIAELGEDAPMTMPDTAYFLACIYAYLGKKVTKLSELKEALGELRNMMGREIPHRSRSSIPASPPRAARRSSKRASTPAPPRPMRERSITVISPTLRFASWAFRWLPRDIPGFVVMIGPAPSVEEAVETVKGYQSRGIFVFMIGGIIDQVHSAGMNTGFGVRCVPVGADIWSVGHVISLVTRATMIFGAIRAGRLRTRFHRYTFDRIFAFVNAYAPVNDITVACGAGAIKMGFPVITNDTNDMWAVPKSLIINTDTKDWIETSLEARGIKIKVTNIDIPVAFSSAYEGEIIRKKDMRIEMDGSRVDCVELVRTKEPHEIEDHLDHAGRSGFRRVRGRRKDPDRLYRRGCRQNHADRLRRRIRA